MKQALKLFLEDKTYFETVQYKILKDKKLQLGIDDFNFSILDLYSDKIEKYNIDIQEVNEFYKWLGERIELCLNLQKGLTNEQLKLMAAEKIKV